MHGIARWAAVGFAVLAVAGGPAQAKEPKPAEAADPVLVERIDAAVKRAGGAEFWGTVLASRGGKVLFAKGYGFADYEKRPNTPDTLFEIASASKQVTAAAILRLEQQKKLKTTYTLDRFFRDAPEHVRKVTVDHLLHHTSGLSPDLGVPYDWSGGRKQYVEQMLAQPLAEEPGKKFSYSNVGYALLAAIVEEVSGKSFEDYVRAELFAPAGMKDSGFVKDDRLLKYDRVTARRAADSQPGETAVDWWYGWGYRGMGGVVTTALDLVKWDAALRGEKVLGAEAKAKQVAPALDRYACGWLVETTERGTTKAHHSGGVRGYAVQIARWLEEDVLVVVLSNGKSDPVAVERAVSALLFPPARIVADLDAGTNEMNRHRAVILEKGASWAVDREGGSLRIRLRVGNHDLATIRAPAGLSTKIAADLESALSQSTFPEPDAPAAMEAGIYLGMLGGRERRYALGEEDELEISVLPRYQGRDESGNPVEDPRVVFILASRRRGGWPVMARMNPSAARALLAAVRKA